MCPFPVQSEPRAVRAGASVVSETQVPALLLLFRPLEQRSISPITSLLKGCKVLIQFLVFGRAAAFGAVFQGLASEPLATPASTLLSINCEVVLIRIYITRLGHLG